MVEKVAEKQRSALDPRFAPSNFQTRLETSVNDPSKTSKTKPVPVVQTDNKKVETAKAQVKHDSMAEGPVIKRYGLDIHTKYLNRPCDNRTNNCNQRPAGAKIKGIVIHHTVISGAKALVKFYLPVKLTEKERVGVSSHYLISRSGDVYLIVEENDRAWHAGSGNFNGVERANDEYVGVELENEWPTDDIMKDCTTRTDFKSQPQYPDVQIRVLNQLINGVQKRYNFPNTEIFYHSDYRPANRCDPGANFPGERLTAGLKPVAVRYSATEPTYKAGQTDKDTADNKGISWDQALLKEAGYTSVKVTGDYDEETVKGVLAFKTHHMRKGDLNGAQIDPETRAKIHGLILARRNSTAEWKAAQKKAQDDSNVKTAGVTPSNPKSGSLRP